MDEARKLVERLRKDAADAMAYGYADKAATLREAADYIERTAQPAAAWTGEYDHDGNPVERPIAAPPAASEDALDLAMMIRKLAYAVKRYNPSLSEAAMDLLKRKGLEGSVLRDDAARGAK